MSADNVLPRGTYCRLDVDSYLEELKAGEASVEVVDNVSTPAPSPTQPEPMNETNSGMETE